MCKLAAAPFDFKPPTCCQTFPAQSCCRLSFPPRSCKAVGDFKEQLAILADTNGNAGARRGVMKRLERNAAACQLARDLKGTKRWAGEGVLCGWSAMRFWPAQMAPDPEGRLQGRCQKASNWGETSQACRMTAHLKACDSALSAALFALRPSPAFRREAAAGGAAVRQGTHNDVHWADS